ncbi:MAG TPA: bifunctional diguanylate cyclase/phosphodiesterase [Lichenihabitans sp.]|jgi:diguanylate cyclase (GGDEF)-like protein|nr:bifunctional diguanylate cyclase/phosphodiesterase [Lichenihabitans sp.]
MRHWQTKPAVTKKATGSTTLLALVTLLGLVAGLAALSTLAERANVRESHAEQQRVLDAVQDQQAMTMRDTARLAPQSRAAIMAGDLDRLDQVYVVGGTDAGAGDSVLLAGTRTEGLDLGPAVSGLARDVASGSAPSADAMLPVGGDLFDAVAMPFTGAGAGQDGGHLRPVLVGLRRIDSDYLAEIARAADVRDLQLARMAADAADEADAIRSADWGGFSLAWDAARPGDSMMMRWSALIVLATAAIAFLIILRARRAAGELHASEARAVEASRNDWLSGLPNRVFFNHMLERELAALEESQGKLALFYLDVDRFKDINDAFGIEAGDAMIQALTQRIAGVVEKGQSIARFEGDAFIILQPGITEPADCDRLAEAIQAVMKAPFEVGGSKVAATLSIGVAIAPDDATERTELVRLANMALHRAKREGRSRLAFYRPALQDEWRRRTAIERELRDAIDNGGLVLRYQPIIDATSGRVVCAEALVRWQHPTEGLIPPDRFISLAEDRGLILPLGEWVLREACRTAGSWPGIGVAVNVSPIQVRQRDFVATVDRILAETGFDPRRLELELTEGVLVDYEAEAVAAMVALRQRGIRLALDDFGTGYSSLIYLRRFAIDKIKIDKAFIDALDPASENMILVDSVIKLGHALGLTVTAEGVETAEQRQLLQSLGCHQLQGYLIAKPLAASDFAIFLAERAHPQPIRFVA